MTVSRRRPRTSTDESARRSVLGLCLAIVGGSSATGCALPVYEASTTSSGSSGAASGGADAGDGGTCIPPPAVDRAIWNKTFRGLGPETASAIAFDGQGNVGLAGSFRGATSFDGNETVLVATGLDAFVAKFDAAGTHVWSLQAGGPGDQQAAAVAFDNSGNLVATGSFAKTFDIGCGPADSQGGEDIFVAKLDPCGNCLWQRTFGGAAAVQFGKGIAVDPDGNVVVVGGFAGIVDFDPFLQNVGDKLDVFIVKLAAADGAHLWSHGFGSDAEDQEAAAVAVDIDGRIVLTGSYSGDMDFGDSTGMLPASPDKQVFVAQREADGSPVWSRGLGGEGDQLGLAIAIGPPGAPTGERSVVVAGRNSGELDFEKVGLDPLTARVGTDAFVAKLEYLGATVFAVGIGDVPMDRTTAGDQFAGGAGLDADGNVLVAGGWEGSGVFPAGTLATTALGDFDAFVLRLDPMGAPQAMTLLQGTSTQRIHALAVDPAGAAHMAGTFEGAIDFGDGPQPSAGELDMFVARLVIGQ